MEYKLTTINDIFDKVPADKIELCCKELGIALSQAAIVRNLVIIGAEAQGITIAKGDIVTLKDEHVWIDDDKGTVDMTFSCNGIEVVSVHTSTDTST